MNLGMVQKVKKKTNGYFSPSSIQTSGHIFANFTECYTVHTGCSAIGYSANLLPYFLVPFVDLLKKLLVIVPIAYSANFLVVLPWAL